MKKTIIIGVFWVFFLLNNHFFKLEKIEINDEVSSFVGLTIDGSFTTTFPTKDSGLAIGSIICDKGANGIWDYEVRFITLVYSFFMRGSAFNIGDGLLIFVREKR